MESLNKLLSHLASKPLAITLYILVITQIVYTIAGSDTDPIKILIDLLNELIKEPELPKFLKTLLHLITKILAWELKNKRMFDIYLLFLLPIFFDNSLSTVALGIVFASIFAASKSIPILFVVYLAHLWLFYSLSSLDTQKFSFIVLFSVSIVIFLISRKEITTLKNEYVDYINHTEIAAQLQRVHRSLDS